jgi:hypothetical protein
MRVRGCYQQVLFRNSCLLVNPLFDLVAQLARNHAGINNREHQDLVPCSEGKASCVQRIQNAVGGRLCEATVLDRWQNPRADVHHRGPGLQPFVCQDNPLQQHPRRDQPYQTPQLQSDQYPAHAHATFPPARFQNLSG